jgi:hypothetical protein
MFKLLQVIWSRAAQILFPKDPYSWQTLIYLGFFSFAMSWVARLVGTLGLTENIIASAGWVFFALGIGWLLNDAKVSLFGLPVAPWVMGAIVCTYVYGLLPGVSPATAVITWPLLSAAIIAVPHFLTWELQPKVPEPTARLQLILFLLIALLLSNWFRFYFRLQSWFEDYPSLIVDDFSESEFVYRMSPLPETQTGGSVLLTAAEGELRQTLNNTPWPYVERWLLNLEERVAAIEARSLDKLDGQAERRLWHLEAQPRTLNGTSYALDLRAVWMGPASSQNGYYLQKTCIIHPVSMPSPDSVTNTDPSTAELAQVKCDLATPKLQGKPAPST